jgi:lipopolysaccharide transport system ATP-binding protein
MSQPIIEARGLSKRYRLGAIGATSVRAELNRYWDRLRGKAPKNGNDFWALRDVSFEVQRGEVVGIIGRNGAGKSTLLKVLSRITEPTTGSAVLRGRVGSLLEVGTGFHPELTGRENIFLNGAILGMTRAEVRSKFDEIVAFAEIDQFLDTPVKRYSSGMYVRLAFAVAAHLEPEILIVDEVLAVGDASFQKKCLGKMGRVASEGRTVLFVSHNLHAVSLLCTRAVLLEKGRLKNTGNAADVIGTYLAEQSRHAAEAAWAFADAPGTANVKLRAVRVTDASGAANSHLSIDQPVQLEMQFWILRSTTMTPSFHVYNREGTLLFALGNVHDATWGKRCYAPGLYGCSCIIPGNFLNEGEHFVTIYLTRDNNAGLVDINLNDVVAFTVDDRGGARGDYVHKWAGLIRPILPWQGSRLGDLPP